MWKFLRIVWTILCNKTCYCCYLVLAYRLRVKSLPVKSKFLYAKLRYHHKTLQGIFLPPNLPIDQILQYNIENCQSYKDTHILSLNILTK